MIRSSAKFSADRKYRVRLDRWWKGPGPRVNFLMLNPSTADENVNDPTVLRCQIRALRMEYSGLIVTNLFSFRATDPTDLKKVSDPIGEGNDEAILEAALEASLVVCAWGTKGHWWERDDHVLNMLCNAGVKPHYLRLTKDGYPEHPLYVPLTQEPSPLVVMQRG